MEAPKKYKLYVEWGTAVKELSDHQISERLKKYLEDYHSPYGGVSMSIFPALMLIPEEKKMDRYAYRYDLQEKHNQDLREELFLCLRLDKDADFDDFAEKFGGLKKAEILEKIKKS